jgi:outer membrane protein assembly factor BamB
MLFYFLLGGGLGLASTLGVVHLLQPTQSLLTLAARTGKPVWVQPLAAKVYGRGPLVFADKVVLSSCLTPSLQSFNPDDCRVFHLQAFDAQSGQQLWTYTPEVNNTGFLAAARESIVLTKEEILLQVRDHLEAVDLATGRVRWSLPRFWFPRDLRSPPFTAGVLESPQNQLVVQQRQPNQRLIQILDPQTGQLVRQFAIPRAKLVTIDERMASNSRYLFVASSELLPGELANTYLASERSTLSAYEQLTGRLGFRQEIKGDLGKIQTGQDTLHLITYSTNDPQRRANRRQWSLSALDSNTGSVLWQKNWDQFGCRNTALSAQAASDAIYLSCASNASKETKSQKSEIVALAARSGQVRWRFPASPNRYVEEFPIATNGQMVFTVRRLAGSLDIQTEQDQVIGLDRQTGKLRWVLPLYNSDDVNRPQSVVAADADHFFVLTQLPRWQVWLLQLNRGWYLKQPE